MRKTKLKMKPWENIIFNKSAGLPSGNDKIHGTSSNRENSDPHRKGFFLKVRSAEEWQYIYYFLVHRQLLFISRSKGTIFLTQRWQVTNTSDILSDFYQIRI